MPDLNGNLMTFDLPNQEIFAAGTWNGDKYGEADLDAMVAAHEQTKGVWGVPLKLSHEHPKGWPAVGWVENLRRVGSKLLGDFKRIPKAIYDMMSAGGYRQKSAEIFWNASVEGKEHSRLLSAVALLGPDPKAVESITDLLTLYASAGGEVKMYQGAGEAKTYDLGQTQKEDGEMEIEALKKQLAEANAALAEAQAQVKKFSAELAEVQGLNGQLQKRAETAEGQVAEYGRKQTATEIAGVVDKLIADKKLAPAKKDYAIQLLTAARTAGAEKKYKVADKEYSMEAILLDILGDQSVQLKTEGETETGERKDVDNLAKAKEYQRQHPEASWKDALRAVAPNGTEAVQA